MKGDESFIAPVRGRIRYKTRKSVKFTYKSPTNVFMTTRTTLLYLQRSIIRKFGLNGRKRVKIYYRILISVVAQCMQYGCLAVKGDDDLQILLHCRKQFPEVRTTELFVEIADSRVSSGGSAPNPRPVIVGGASGSRNQCEIDIPQVTSPSFDFNLQAEAATGGNELGNSRSFGELGVAMAATPQPVSPPAFEGVPDPDPHVGEALRPDDSDVEPEFIEGDSDDEAGLIPPPQRGTSSSGTQQYPPHLSNLNLDALSGPS
ncbi:hypothetical protein PIB30_022707 [Stylosanthes scabra]|uniref:Uncharacterized protein n=1 Tax=Stylosanthes scabra TaxID=79078 RepID=A0ABU6X7G6_9FABA|nr:hypothetical protein [Stylosanthes scabra]